MNKNKANIGIKDNSIVLTYNNNTFTVGEMDLKRLIGEHTTKENFIEMASAMTKDFLTMEGYDWDYDTSELERKLSIVYKSII